MRPAIALIAILAAAPALAQRASPTDWPPLLPRFESTGVGGWMINDYQPVVVGTHCATNFVAISPDDQIFRDEVEFGAIPAPGGVLCENGRRRAKDGSSSGTTPLLVFIRNDGNRFRSP